MFYPKNKKNDTDFVALLHTLERGQDTNVILVARFCGSRWT